MYPKDLLVSVSLALALFTRVLGDQTEVHLLLSSVSAAYMGLDVGHLPDTGSAPAVTPLKKRSPFPPAAVKCQ